MTTITNILFTIAIILLGLSLYFGLRNNLVYQFKIYLLNTGCQICTDFLNSIDTENTSNSDFEEKIEEYDKLTKIWHSIDDIPYEKMLFSFKPLQPKYWLTQEQIDFLNSYYVLFKDHNLQKPIDIE